MEQASRFRRLFSTKRKKIVPKCISGYRWMFDSTGQFRPCCWIDPRDFDHPDFNINKNSLNKIFQTKAFKKFQKSLYRYETAPLGCQRACGEESNRSVFFHGKSKKYGFARNMKVFNWSK